MSQEHHPEEFAHLRTHYTGLTEPSSHRAGNMVSLRLAIRTISKNRLRHAFIALLVGFPAFIVAVTGTLLASTGNPSPMEHANRILSGFDGVIMQPSDAPMGGQPEDPGEDTNGDAGTPADSAAEGKDGPGGASGRTYPAPTDPNTRLSANQLRTLGINTTQATHNAKKHQVCNSEPCEIKDALPSGTSATTVETVNVDLLGLDNGAPTQAIIADFKNPHLTDDQGRFQLLDGSFPDQKSEQVMISPELEKQLDQAKTRATARGKDTVPEDHVGLRDPDGNSKSGTYTNLPVVGQALDTDTQWPRLANMLSLSSDSAPLLFIQEGSEAAKKLSGSGTQRLYVSGDVPTDYASTLAYDAAELSAVFRPVAQEYGSSEVESDSHLLVPWGDDAADQSRALPVGVLAAVAFGEAVLISGFALALSARRQGRMLALLSVVGGEPRILRQVVLLAGVICSAVGAVAGGVAGAGVGRLWIWFAQNAHVPVFGPHIPWLGISVAMLLSFVAGTVTAWSVGMNASHRALNATAGAPGGMAPAPRRFFTWLGWGLLVVGLASSTALTIHGMALNSEAALHRSMGLLGIGQMIALLLLLAGVLFLLPKLLHLMSSTGKRLPLVFRLSLRDATRRRARTLPLLATVISMTVAGVYGVTLLAMQNSPSVAPSAYALAPDSHTGWVSVDDRTSLERRALTQGENEGKSITVEELAEKEGVFSGGAMEVHQKLAELGQLPGAPQPQHGWDVHTAKPTCATQFSTSCTEFYPIYPSGSLCSLPTPTQDTYEARSSTLNKSIEKLSREQQRKCGGPGGAVHGLDLDSPAQSVMVVDPERPETMPSPFWANDSDAVEALREGRAVVADPEYVSADETITLGEFSTDPVGEGIQVSDDDESEIGMSSLNTRWPMWDPIQERTLRAEVVEADSQGARPTVVVPVSALEGTKQRMGLGGVLVDFSSAVTDSQTELVNSELASSDLTMNTNANLEVSADPFSWPITGAAALMIITTAVLTAGIGITDSRRDQSLIMVMGATGQLRRWFAAVQGFVLAGTGVLLGIVVALPPLFGFGLVELYSISWMPWKQLLALAIAVPVGSSLVAGTLMPNARLRRL